MITLNVLDQSPIFRGNTANDAIRETIALAQIVENLGYLRFWVTEHHSTTVFACTSPEILTAAIAANTSFIRVGAGGIILPYYSPLKVAENFRMLHSLFPNRIDLGIGRGPGASLQVSQIIKDLGYKKGKERSCLWFPSKKTTQTYNYTQQVKNVVDFVRGTLSTDYVHKNLCIMPDGKGFPDIWMLGSSANGAQIAAMLGLPFCFAQFIHNRVQPQVLTLYRDNFRPSQFLSAPRASIAIRVLCSETDEEAHKLASSFWASVRQQKKGHLSEGPTRFPSLKDLANYEWTPQDLTYIDDNYLMMMAGSISQVRKSIMEMIDIYKTEDLFITTICPDFQSRIKIFRLLSDAFH
jgi:luciferase family oxidoreductase group 1